MQRPASVPRHSYENIKESGSYTINHIHAEFTDRAHYTSAKFSREESEFEAAGLTEVYLEDFPAPFVKESTIKLGMSFLEEYQIRASSTILIVGQVELISLPSNLVKSNGQIDLDEASSVAISGLNNYHQAKMIASYPYAKPGIFPVNSLKSS
jgi:flavin reductase (DIM6/NTAB) family NADH-FMN oxidoreductase RutF